METEHRMEQRGEEFVFLQTVPDHSLVEVKEGNGYEVILSVEGDRIVSITKGTQEVDLKSLSERGAVFEKITIPDVRSQPTVVLRATTLAVSVNHNTFKHTGYLKHDYTPTDPNTKVIIVGTSWQVNHFPDIGS